MTIENRRGRPAGSGPAEIVEDSTTDSPTVLHTLNLRQRRAESWRRPPLDDGTGRRDPLDPTLHGHCPSTFGLDPDDLLELARHHWRSYGWQPWECRHRFAIGEVA